MQKVHSGMVLVVQPEDYYLGQSLYLPVDDLTQEQVDYLYCTICYTYDVKGHADDFEEEVEEDYEWSEIELLVAKEIANPCDDRRDFIREASKLIPLSINLDWGPILRAGFAFQRPRRGTLTIQDKHIIANVIGHEELIQIGMVSIGNETIAIDSLTDDEANHVYKFLVCHRDPVIMAIADKNSRDAKEQLWDLSHYLHLRADSRTPRD